MPSHRTVKTTPEARRRFLDRAVAASLAALAVIFAPASRADERPASRLFHEVGLAPSFPTGVVAAASYTPTLSIFDGRLNVGLGARFSFYFDGGAVPYPNGDADLLAAGANNTLMVSRPRNYALNLMFGISARIHRGLEAGLNIDLLGVGLGPEVTGTYAGADPAFAGAQLASPTRFNLLLFGRHDRGQLDSEFFLAYWFGSLGVRAGVSHMSTEYTTSHRLDAGNDRFRASATRFFIAGGYRF
jgi:hypothetical protein